MAKGSPRFTDHIDRMDASLRHAVNDDGAIERQRRKKRVAKIAERCERLEAKYGRL